MMIKYGSFTFLQLTSLLSKQEIHTLRASQLTLSSVYKPPEPPEPPEPPVVIGGLDDMPPGPAEVIGGLDPPGEVLE